MRPPWDQRNHTFGTWHLAPGTWHMLMLIGVPDALACHLAAVAEQREMTVDELCAQQLTAGLLADDRPAASIASIRSGRKEFARRHRQIKAEATERIAARNL